VPFKDHEPEGITTVSIDPNPKAPDTPENPSTDPVVPPVDPSTEPATIPSERPNPPERDDDDAPERDNSDAE
jgi:hypothetical protein